MGTPQIWLPDGELTGAVIRGDNSASLPSSQTHSVHGLRAAAVKFNHIKTVVYLHNLSTQEFRGLCRHSCIYLHIIP